MACRLPQVGTTAGSRGGSPIRQETAHSKCVQCGFESRSPHHVRTMPTPYWSDPSIVPVVASWCARTGMLPGPLSPGRAGRVDPQRRASTTSHPFFWRQPCHALNAPTSATTGTPTPSPSTRTGETTKRAEPAAGMGGRRQRTSVIGSAPAVRSKSTSMARTERTRYDGQKIRDGQHGRRCPEPHCSWCIRKPDLPKREHITRSKEES